MQTCRLLVLCVYIAYSLLLMWTEHACNHFHAFSCLCVCVCVGVCIELLYQPAAHSGQIVSQITLAAVDALQTACQTELCYMVKSLAGSCSGLAGRRKLYTIFRSINPQTQMQSFYLDMCVLTVYLCMHFVKTLGLSQLQMVIPGNCWLAAIIHSV